MKPGDEVLMTDQEHPGGEHPVGISRPSATAVVVKKITLPRPVKDAAQVLNLFNDAITPRTRVIFFSHITTFSGVVLPAKELCCPRAHEGNSLRGRWRACPRHDALNIHDLGCDMYSSSPHKWLQATEGSGFLYVRDEVIDRLWNTIATEGWDEPRFAPNASSASAVRTCPHCGACAPPSNSPTTSAWIASSAATAHLADYMLAEMKKRGAESWTSPDPALRCGIVSVNVPPVPAWIWRTGSGRRTRSAIRGGDRTSCAFRRPTTCRRKTSTAFWTIRRVQEEGLAEHHQAGPAPGFPSCTFVPSWLMPLPQS